MTKNIIRVAQKAFILKNGKLLVIKTRATDHSPLCWELPGGAVEFDENLADSFKREIKEETNLQILVGEPFVIWESWHDYRGNKAHTVFIGYQCQWKKGIVKISNEHAAYKWIDPKNFDKYQFIESFEFAIKKYIQLIKTK